MKKDSHQEGTIFTIGHSNQETEPFLQLLKDNRIEVVVDVRSAPYSRYVPHFNKGNIEAAVKAVGLKYIFMGDVIGGIPTDPQFLNPDVRVHYEILAATETFQQGLDRLAKGLADGWRIVLMCAEEDPLRCHRHHLISRELTLKRHIPVWHIRADGTSMRAIELMENQPTQMNLFQGAP